MEIVEVSAKLATLVIEDREKWTEGNVEEFVRWMKAKTKEIEKKADTYSSKVRFKLYTGDTGGR